MTTVECIIFLDLPSDIGDTPLWTGKFGRSLNNVFLCHVNVDTGSVAFVNVILDEGVDPLIKQN